MIPKLQARGKSFSGLAAYLTHDPKEKTDERVAWTHTLNLAHDHVPSAVDEMLWTARAAELLKQEAGIRAGGRATENPVKHFSLNWSPEDDPSREHMIKATEDFLKHMQWHEHQAILVAHNDKDYAHVHVMLNAIHPETGLRLNEKFDYRRAQAWALDYEKEQGRIYCEQRLLDSEEREEAPTRPAWMAFKNQQRQFENSEKSIRENSADYSENAENDRENKNDPKIAAFADWKKLKEIQRHERESFFAEGKLAFSELRSSIYREIREEFRERWADLYAAKKDGADANLWAEAKAELVAEQKALLAERRDSACKELRETRDSDYRELLDGQREDRAALRWRQEAGLDNAIFFRTLEDRGLHQGAPNLFNGAAEETTRPEGNEWNFVASPYTGTPHERTGLKPGTDIGANFATGIGFGAISFLESLVDGFVGAKPAPRPKPREPDPARPDPFDVIIDEGRKRQRSQQEEADEEWRKKQRSYGE